MTPAPLTAIAAIEKAMEGVTPGPWKAVSDAHFDNGLVYTSVQPINIDEDAMKPLAMANGEYHVCRMSHTAAPWRFNYHRANAAYIAACNPVAMREVLAAARKAEELQRENERLRLALADVVNPLDNLRRYAEERDATLVSGAYSIANNLGFVQSIAKTALEATTPLKDSADANG